MSRPIIEVENLAKRYQLGVIGATSLKDAMSRWWHRRRTSPAEPSGEFWALRDASFSVEPGEVVGIIGRNGAGKSTLLKILSRITEPTSGRAVLRGRVASLLEVGTGFHPDLTGRENIFLNGTILGMTRAEIRRNFDEIVAFSEVEKFIDTPVKRYSSGMYVRLAFAVAAHLEPEILIIDEVLAVGDTAFQKKCLGKMKQVATHGRAILFVSHNLTAVRTLCQRGLLFKDGRLVGDRPVGAAIEQYLEGSLTGENVRRWTRPGDAPGNESIRIDQISVRPPDGENHLTIDTGAVLEIGFRNFEPNINLDCTVYLINAEGVLLFESGCLLSTEHDSRVGRYSIVGRLPPHLLNAGRYSFNLVFGRNQHYVLYKIDEAIAFEVENTQTGRGLNFAVASGVVRPLLSWKSDFVPSTS